MSRRAYFKLFLSYTSLNRQTAGFLRPSLKRYGISLFAAHDDLEPNSIWRDELERALKDSDGLAALLTQDFHASEWTDHEVGFAFGANKVVLPLVYDAVPYGLLAKFQGIKITGRSYQRIAYDIAESLLTHPKARRRMAEALASCFKEERDAKHIEVLAGLLGKANRLSHSGILELEEAAKTNPRIKKTNSLKFWILSIAENHRTLNGE